MIININLMRNNVVQPHFSETDSSIMVFFANLEYEETILMPGASTPVSLGVALDIEPGYMPLIRLTSDLKTKGITHAVTYGVNDELILILRNNSSSAIRIENGGEVACGIFVKTVTAEDAQIYINQMRE